MKEIRWSLLKSKRLKRTRGVSFEEIVVAGKLVDIRGHAQKINQQLMLFEYKNYIWIVPFVQRQDEIFLKTFYPSRKYTRLYKKEARKDAAD